MNKDPVRNNGFVSQKLKINKLVVKESGFLIV